MMVPSTSERAIPLARLVRGRVGQPTFLMFRFFFAYLLAYFGMVRTISRALSTCQGDVRLMLMRYVGGLAHTRVRDYYLR